MPNYGAVRKKLVERLEEIARRVGKIEGDLRRLRDKDWQEQAIEVENDEVLEGLDALSLAEVRQIRDALRRIDEGNYGTCVRCGKPIAPERLAAVPSVLTCVHCAS